MHYTATPYHPGLLPTDVAVIFAVGSCGVGDQPRSARTTQGLAAGFVEPNRTRRARAVLCQFLARWTVVCNVSDYITTTSAQRVVRRTALSACSSLLLSITCQGRITFVMSRVVTANVVTLYYSVSVKLFWTLY